MVPMGDSNPREVSRTGFRGLDDRAHLGIGETLSGFIEIPLEPVVLYCQLRLLDQFGLVLLQQFAIRLNLLINDFELVAF